MYTLFLVKLLGYPELLNQHVMFWGYVQNMKHLLQSLVATDQENGLRLGAGAGSGRSLPCQALTFQRLDYGRVQRETPRCPEQQGGSWGYLPTERKCLTF